MRPFNNNSYDIIIDESDKSVINENNDHCNFRCKELFKDYKQNNITPADAGVY